MKFIYAVKNIFHVIIVFVFMFNLYRLTQVFHIQIARAKSPSYKSISTSNDFSESVIPLPRIELDVNPNLAPQNPGH